MRWTPGGVSGDIEDRRAKGGRRITGTHLGLGGTLLLLLLSIILRQDFLSLFSGSSGVRPPGGEALGAAIQDPEEAKLVQFASFMLDDAQNTWEQLLPQQRTVLYRHAKLALFYDATDSSCGLAQSATGPFYRPGWRQAYEQQARWERSVATDDGGIREPGFIYPRFFSAARKVVRAWSCRQRACSM